MYDDLERAQACATLKLLGTYYLAYRDLPAIITKYVTGRQALDFGCGAGRSTRFLKDLAIRIVGLPLWCYGRVAQRAPNFARARLRASADMTPALSRIWFL